MKTMLRLVGVLGATAIVDDQDEELGIREHAVFALHQACGDDTARAVATLGAIAMQGVRQADVRLGERVVADIRSADSLAGALEVTCQLGEPALVDESPLVLTVVGGPAAATEASVSELATKPR